MPELNSIQDIQKLLRETRTVAVLGANPRQDRPAHYVPAYLRERGVRVLPVNPVHAGETLWGQTVRATLAELGEPVDFVDVFRRPEVLPEHLTDILAMNPRPRAVWLQSGIRNDAFTRQLVTAGIDVVVDRCAMVDHRRMVP